MERKILFVEDNQNVLGRWQSSIKQRIRGYDFVFLTAKSLLEAQVQFKYNPDIDLIVIGACVPGIDLNTVPLIKEFRSMFKGHMLAVSNNGDYRQKMRTAGCDDSCEMRDVFKTIKELFNSDSRVKLTENPKAYA